MVNYFQEKECTNTTDSGYITLPSGHSVRSLKQQVFMHSFNFIYFLNLFFKIIFYTDIFSQVTALLSEPLFNFLKISNNNSSSTQINRKTNSDKSLPSQSTTSIPHQENRPTLFARQISHMLVIQPRFQILILRKKQMEAKIDTKKFYKFLNFTLLQ